MKAAPLLLILAANLIGGLTYPWQKMALAGLPPATVSLGRNVVALLCMAAWLLPRGGLRLRFTSREWLRLFVLGVFAYALPLLLGIVGMQSSTSSNASILILLEPASILVFSWLLLAEPVRRTQLLGFVLGLGGALLLVLGEAPASGLLAGEYLMGNLVLAAHGVLWGLYSPIVKPLAERHSPVQITFVAMLMGLVLLVPAAAYEAPRWAASPQLAEALWRTLELGVVGSFLSTAFWTWSLRSLPASAVAPFVFVQPLAGALAGTLLLGETLSSAALAAAALIGAGVLLVIR